MAEQKTVVLVGAGHAHLYVAARARDFRARGYRLVVVDPGTFWYSGLATGMLGGMAEPADDQLDAEKLVLCQGGEFVRDRVVEVDLGERRLSLAGGSELSYDLLSFNVGSVVDASAIPGAEKDPNVWTVKPVARLWQLRRQLEARFQRGETPSVAVVGGGASGCEVAGNLLSLAAEMSAALEVTLITRGPGLLAGAPRGAGEAARRALSRRGLQIRTCARVAERTESGLLLDGGEQIAAEHVVLATGLEASPLVMELDLPSEPAEGLLINEYLHSPADPHVFAVGDCAAWRGGALPKLGVFGVRQAPFLHRNLLAGLNGSAPSAYQPQNRWLSILNLGQGDALALRGSWWWRGRASLILKNWLDRRFLEHYRQLSHCGKESLAPSSDANHSSATDSNA
ncbi:pyridine nucleotide-disulfide oxidoreductase [Proteobacteria bacterium 005FR1]|nr:pyridine nucleotide-disulfide oxidoreductase [Proteobacteria bacterium 005FR1]